MVPKNVDPNKTWVKMGSIPTEIFLIWTNVAMTNVAWTNVPVTRDSLNLFKMVLGLID